MNRREFICSGMMLTTFEKLSIPTLFTTWVEKEFLCPVCSTKNIYRVIGSFGTYIYGWPSKYQVIYWPVTDGNSVYCCKKCHLTLFMWDHDDLASEKVAAIRKVLDGLEVKLTFTDYARVPMTQRLVIAEKIYQALEMKDEFWCRFYRILGYHYAAENDQAKAELARRNALRFVERMIAGKSSATPMKELLLISGAMKHFLRDDSGSLAEFGAALRTRYENKEASAEDNRNAEKNLNDFIKEYIDRVKSKKPPRDDEQ